MSALIENDSNTSGGDIVDILVSCAMCCEQLPEEPPKNGKPTAKYAGYYARYATYKKQYQKDNRDKINDYQRERYRAKAKQSKLLKALEFIQSNITAK